MSNFHDFEYVPSEREFPILTPEKSIHFAVPLFLVLIVLISWCNMFVSGKKIVDRTKNVKNQIPSLNEKVWSFLFSN